MRASSCLSACPRPAARRSESACPPHARLIQFQPAAVASVTAGSVPARWRRGGAGLQRPTLISGEQHTSYCASVATRTHPQTPPPPPPPAALRSLAAKQSLRRHVPRIPTSNLVDGVAQSARSDWSTLDFFGRRPAFPERRAS